MAERSEAVEEQAVRDASAVYSVKADIAATENMPPGYKRTEVGVIPEDWEVESLGEYVTITSGESPSLLVFSSDGFPYFKVEQLGNSEKYLVAESTPYHFSEGKTVTGGSLIFAKRGAAIALNKIRLLGTASFMDTNLMVLTPNENLEREYLYYQLGYIGLWRFADTTSVPQINNKHVKPLPFPLPRKEEQRAIANALSDADALIESLDRLIAKKRAIKQAAMQQLLTGQTRLPGFTGEWETKRLGEIGTFYKGQGIRRDDVSDEGVPCIRYGEIYTRYSDCVIAPESRISESVSESAFPLRSGDILFAGSGETAEEIGMCVAYLGEQPAFAGGDIVVLRPNGGISAYLGRLLNHPTIAQQKARLGQGDAVVHISARNLAQIEVHLPNPEEQTAIATVLSDMDTEIETLEHRRDKTRQIKQGMMQQLLTGRVRLVEPELSAEAAI